jgi:hypothetical protein
MAARPSLCKLGGEQNAAEYYAEFNRLYRTEQFRDVRGFVILFEPDRSQHVCMTSADKIHNDGPRTVWDQLRAERISWIGPTLQAPFEILPAYQTKPGEPPSRKQIYLVKTDGTPATGGEPTVPDEYYIVVVVVEGKRLARFITAYDITRGEWNQMRQVGPTIYPIPAVRRKK